ncbi:hypothetical protein HID58_066004, partial [Brassica napus]
FITVKTVFTNFAARRLHQNEFGLAEVVYMMRSAEYQATKRCNNVQLAEETVAHCQARALERQVTMMDQIEAFSHDRKRWRILYDDENFVEYVRDKEVKVQIKHWFNVLEK